MRVAQALITVFLLAACEQQRAVSESEHSAAEVQQVRTVGPPQAPSICLPDALDALRARMRMAGIWNNDPVAGAMSPRMANANISTHDETSLRRGMARYGPTTAALITFAGVSESCAWLVSGEGIVAYGRNGVDAEQVYADVRSVIDALGVEGASAARAPSPRGPSAPGSPPPANQADAHTAALDVALTHVAQSVLPEGLGGALAQFENLIVVPNEMLAGFPFMLLRSSPSEYIIDRMSIQVAPALAELGIGPGLHTALNVDLARMTAEARAATLADALIVGDPHFNDLAYEMPQLPGAAEEARGVASVLGAVSLTDRQASLASVRTRLAQRPRYLHFATHGLADENDIANNRGFLALANGDRLTLEDVRAVRMRSGAIVVLSACQSGLGASRPGGVVGLPLAFQNAGAQTVVMSLWNVDDAATGYLMQAFASRLKQSGRPALAFAEAVRTTRQAYPDPRLWASFEVFGVGPP